MFKGIDEPTLAAIAEVGRVTEYEEGDVLYGLGDDADDVYVLVSGRVRFTLGVAPRTPLLSSGRARFARVSRRPV